MTKNRVKYIENQIKRYIKNYYNYMYKINIFHNIKTENSWEKQNNIIKLRLKLIKKTIYLNIISYIKRKLLELTIEGQIDPKKLIENILKH